MSEHTGTLWVVLMTPQKNLLAKISSLKTYGKIKIEELKVSYRRKKEGSWLFEILNQPRSRTFSFHDGDVVLKIKNGYVPLRRHSLRVFYLVATVFCGLIAVVPAQKWFQANSVRTVVKDRMTSTKFIPVNIKQETQQVQDPKMHELFLHAKREFQYGQLASSFSKLKKNMNAMAEADQKEASSMIAEMYFLQCENFQRQHEERKAVMSCEKAMSFSQHPKADLFLSAQDEKSRKLYLEGYTIQKFDPKGAKKKYALVLQSSQTKSPWRGKAQHQLRKLK